MKQFRSHITHYIALLLIVASVSAPAFAIETETEQETENTGTSQQTQTTEQTETGTNKRTTRLAKLETKQLELCQKKETVIKQKLSTMNDRGTRQLAVFDKIFERVKAFKESKSLTVTNYNTLVADVQAKRTAAETAINATTSNSNGFSCSADDPKGVADAFKTSLKSEIAALKDYKTALKNLIVAVKSAQSTSTEGGN